MTLSSCLPLLLQSSFHLVVFFNIYNGYFEALLNVTSGHSPRQFLLPAFSTVYFVYVFFMVTFSVSLHIL